MGRRNKKGNASQDGSTVAVDPGTSVGPSSGSFAGTSSSAGIQIHLPPEPREYQSPFGWVYRDRIASDPNPDRILDMAEMRRITLRGFALGSGGAVDATDMPIRALRDVDDLWETGFAQLVHLAEKVDGYAHSTFVLNDPTEFLNYCQMYTTLVANCVAMSASLDLTHYGRSGRATLTAWSSLRGRIDRVTRAATSIPMFDAFHQLAVRFGMPLRAGAGSALYRRFYSFQDMENWDGYTPHDWLLGSDTWQIDSNADLLALLDDMEAAVDYLDSRTTTATVNTVSDLRNIYRLLEMIGIKAHVMSQRDVGNVGVIDDPGEWDKYLFREAFVGNNNQGAGVGTAVAFPVATSDTDLILRRGMGTPDRELFAGIGPTYASEARTIVNSVDDSYLLGVNHSGVKAADFANLVGVVRLIEVWTDEGSWSPMDTEGDFGTLDDLESLVSSMHLMMEHQWSHIITAVDEFEQDRVANQLVDYSFHQPVGHIAEGYLVWLSETMGIPIAL